MSARSLFLALSVVFAGALLTSAEEIKPDPARESAGYADPLAQTSLMRASDSLLFTQPLEGGAFPALRTGAAAASTSSGVVSIFGIVCSLVPGACSGALICSLNLGACSGGVVCSANLGACSASVYLCSGTIGACSAAGVYCSASAGICSVSATSCSQSVGACSASVGLCSQSLAACSVSFGSCSQSAGACSVARVTCSASLGACRTRPGNIPPGAQAPADLVPRRGLQESFSLAFGSAAERQSLLGDSLARAASRLSGTPN